jgi:cystathionine beta-lyase/cystathionine gamma-synthase
MKFDTLAVHFAQDPDPTTGALVTPLTATATFVQDAPGTHRGFDYARTNHPTRKTLEDVLAALEETEHCAVFASGLAAEQAVLQAFLRPGDRVLTGRDVYGGTYRLLEKVWRPLGVVAEAVDFADPAARAAALRTQARIVWVESPTNPRLEVVDLAAVAAEARAAGALVVVDNTFASPANQLPFRLGADLVVHSVTKYLAGHSDLIQGAVLARNAELFAPVKFLQNATGAVPSAFDCWLTLRGLKTLGLRVARHNANAQAVAEFLAKRPEVARVRYPGLPSDPGHAAARRQMHGFGGVVAFEAHAEPEDVRRFVSERRFFKLAESLGGVKSLIAWPAGMTHASIPAAERRARGLSDVLVRLSCGVEDPEDLLADLLEGLSRLPQRAARAAVAPAT